MKSTRRTFLQSTALTAGCLLTGTAGAIEPIQRNGIPKFKFSLSAYSYRSLLQSKDAEFTLADFIDDCARFGLEGTELTSYYLPQEVTAEYLTGLRQQCFRLGLDVSGTAVGNDFGHPAGEARDQQIAALKQWIEHAAVLGAPVIRIFAGHPKKGVPAEATHKLIVSAIEECCDYAGRHGVHLALENHGGPTATAEGLLSIVRDVNSPWFGVNLDTGNFHTEDIYADLAAAAPYALNVQVKVVVSGPDRKKQPTDFARLAGILREANYRGYVVLEYEEAGGIREECEKYLDQLREAFG